MPHGTDQDYIEESQQLTTLDKENAPTLPSEFDEPSSQDDLQAHSENTNLAHSSVADLQVGPSVQNPNKRKHATQECVSENQENYCITRK